MRELDHGLRLRETAFHPTLDLVKSPIELLIEARVRFRDEADLVLEPLRCEVEVEPRFRDARIQQSLQISLIHRLNITTSTCGTSRGVATQF